MSPQFSDGNAVMWIGGTLGLQRYDSKRLDTVGSSYGEIRAVSGIVPRANGDIWFTNSAGLAWIDKEEVKKFAQDPNKKIRYDRFDVLDGMPGAPLSSARLPSLVQGSDCRLWSTTSSSLVSINPYSISRNAIKPSVVVTSVGIDGVTHRVLTNLKVPQRPQNITINYTALSLTMPERVRFRYQLEKFDKD